MQILIIWLSGVIVSYFLLKRCSLGYSSEYQRINYPAKWTFEKRLFIILVSICLSWAAAVIGIGLNIYLWLCPMMKKECNW